MSLSLRTSLAALAVVLATTASVRADDQPTGKPIDLVLCLDTSNSMDGLIDSAKAKLWDVVNELARLKPTPDLRVALYSYGNDNHNPADGWVKKEVDLTTDLDEVYRVLNALRTRGGTEYVARVTRDALKQQQWSTDPGALKIIFVCGNEPVDQDKQVSLESVADVAKQKGVIVNTIYCRYGHDNEIPGWAKFSEKCGGRHINIDQNKGAQAVTIKTEYDDEILKLNDKVNGTYVAYGKDGRMRAENQTAQDRNAANAPQGGGPGAPSAGALARAETKAGKLYRNAEWDLVDRMKEKDFDITKIKDEELPEELRKLKPEERLAYLKKKAEERAALQERILELSAKRQKVLDAERARQPRSESDKALDEAVKTTVRDQAKAKGFEVPAEQK
jgi:hypothetical protein